MMEGAEDHNPDITVPYSTRLPGLGLGCLEKL